MKVKIEVEIKSNDVDDLQALLVAQLYEKCKAWVQEEEVPMIEFEFDMDELEDVYPESRSDFEWIWNQPDDLVN